MKICIRTVSWLLIALLLASSAPFEAYAKSYSSGSKSYSSSSSRSSSSRSSGSSSRSSSSSSRSSSSSSSKSSGSKSSSGSSSSRSSGSKTSSSKPSSSSSSSSTSGSSTRSGNSGGNSSSASKGTSSSQRSDSTSSSSGKNFTSSNRKSYSSRSTDSDDDKRSYSSSKSYSSDSGQKFSTRSSSDRRQSERSAPTAPSDFTFDTEAARARKQELSKQEYTRFKEEQVSRTQPAPATAPLPVAPSAREGEAYKGPVPPPIANTPASEPRNYVPDRQTIASRAWREDEYFREYYSRPVVVYRDRYNNYFWWWLLERSLEDRARWAYHHRPIMDPSRYEALVASDAQLEQRVAQLEAEQAVRDPGYVPAGMEKDLMYSDHFVATAYSNRPTRGGTIAFWLIGVPTAIGLCWFFIWLIWFKRWQTQN